MTEYAVTGISYTIAPGMPREEQKQAAHEYITALPKGTPLILQAEPDNTHDTNAIAVYADYTRHIGYVKSTCCLDIKPLLDENGQCDATVAGNDGWVTLYVTVSDAPETPAPITERQRVLPESPLAAVLKMPFTSEERSQCVVATRLLKLRPDKDHAAEVATVAAHYLPYASLSICYEDGYWRERILSLLRETCKLDLEEGLKRQLEELRDRLQDVEGDRTCIEEHAKRLVLEQQLERLQTLAEGENGLFADFEYHIATSGRSVKEETDLLEQWFRNMPQLQLRDWRDHERLAECLTYQRVSRKELYEVFAAILILQRFKCVEEQSGDEDFADIRAYVKKVERLLAADWSGENYEALWNKVLALPAVKAQAHNRGKQRGTTFNRNLIANMLHTMMLKGVFAAGTTNQAMAEALEGTKDHSVRDAVGRGLEDRVMKGNIVQLIYEMHQT